MISSKYVLYRTWSIMSNKVVLYTRSLTHLLTQENVSRIVALGGEEPSGRCDSFPWMRARLQDFLFWLKSLAASCVSLETTVDNLSEGGNICQNLPFLLSQLFRISSARSLPVFSKCLSIVILSWASPADVSTRWTKTISQLTFSKKSSSVLS